MRSRRSHVAALAVLAAACGRVESQDTDAGESPSCATNQVTTLGGGIGGVGNVLVDSTSAYWWSFTNDPPPGGALLKRSSTPFEAPTTIAAPCKIADCYASFTLDEANVYYGGADENGPFIAGVAKSGGASTTLVRSASAYVVGAVDATTLYLWSGSEIATVPKTGGTPVVVVQEANVVFLGVDGSDIYWTSSTDAPGESVLTSTSTADGSSVEVATFAGVITAFTSDATNLYVATAPAAQAASAQTGAVSLIVKPSGEPHLLVTCPRTQNLAINGATLFIGSEEGISAVSTDGGPLISTVVSEPIQSFAVDDLAFTWAMDRSVGGSVYRVCR